MKRRYVFTGLGLVLAIAIAAPVIAQNAEKSAVGKAAKKAIKKEVAKQLKNKSGPTGPAGAPGAPGAPGPRGPSESFIKTGSAGTLGTSMESVVSVGGNEVGGGTFAVTARVVAFDQPAGNIANNGNVDCRLRLDGPVTDTTLDEAALEVSENPGDDPSAVEEGTISLVADTRLGSGSILQSFIRLECKATNAAADVFARDGVLRLIRVEDSTDLTP